MIQIAFALVNDAPTELLQELAQKTFANNTCLLYFYQPISIIDVDGILRNCTALSRKNFHVSTTLQFIAEEVEGYVFDFTGGGTLSTITSVMSAIKPHTRAIIVLNSENQSSFIEKFLLKGVDVIALLLNCLEEEHCLRFNDGKILRLDKKNPLSGMIFSAKPWRPVFREPFRVGLFNCIPFVMFNKNKEPTTGAEYSFIKHITKDFPITYLKINATGNEAFAEVRNAVITGKVDLGVCALWMTKDLHEMNVVETIYPHDNLCATFLVPKPKLYVGLLYPFFPLHPNLWLAVLFAVLLIYFTILIFAKIGKRSVNKGEALLQIIRVLSAGSVPRATQSFKQLLLPWSVTCMILTDTYSAGITSTMHVPRYTKPIHTFSDVVEQRLKLTGTPKFIDEVCKNSQNPTLTKLRDYFVDDAHVSAGEAYGIFVKRVQGHYVMNAEQLNESQQNKYVILSECLVNLYLTLLVPRNSPFKRFFDEQSLLLQEHGIMAAWKRNLTDGGHFGYMKKFFADHEVEYGYKPVDVNEIKGAILFLICGYLLAILAFVREVKSSRKQNKYK